MTLRTVFRLTMSPFDWIGLKLTRLFCEHDVCPVRKRCIYCGKAQLRE